MATTQLISATGQTAPATLAALPRLRLGGMALNNIRAAFADLHIFSLWGLNDRPAMLVGIDVRPAVGMLYGVSANDPAVLAAFRADPIVGSMRGSIDGVATTEQLEHIAGLLPDEWLAPARAASQSAACSTRSCTA